MKTEIDLVELYLRLNGFFTVTGSEGIKVPGSAASARREVDVMAIKLPSVEHSFQVTGQARVPDPELALSPDAIEVVIGEVNDPTSVRLEIQDPGVIEQAIVSFDCCQGDPATMAHTLVRSGRAVSFLHGSRLRVRFILFGSEEQSRHLYTVISMEQVVDFVARNLPKGRLEPPDGSRRSGQLPDECSPTEVAVSSSGTFAD